MKTVLDYVQPLSPYEPEGDFLLTILAEAKQETFFDTPVEEALCRMRETNTDYLPVFDRGKIFGIVYKRVIEAAARRKN